MIFSHNPARRCKTMGNSGETLPDNPRENATTSPWAGLQRDLCPVDVWYSPYVPSYGVLVNRRSLDNPGVLVRVT